MTPRPVSESSRLVGSLIPKLPTLNRNQAAFCRKLLKAAWHHQRFRTEHQRPALDQSQEPRAPRLRRKRNLDKARTQRLAARSRDHLIGGLEYKSFMPAWRSFIGTNWNDITANILLGLTTNGLGEGKLKAKCVCPFRKSRGASPCGIFDNRHGRVVQLRRCRSQVWLNLRKMRATSFPYIEQHPAWQLLCRS